MSDPFDIVSRDWARSWGWVVRRSRVITVSVVAALALGVASALLLRGGDDRAAVAHANDVSGNFRACLVDRPAAADASAAAWQALQKAAATGRVNAQEFPVPAGGGAAPYLNGVAGVGCNVVVVADKALTPAVSGVAAKAGQQRFLIVGKGTASGNVEVVADATGLSAWLASHAGG
jgi:hypothetical protein